MMKSVECLLMGDSYQADAFADVLSDAGTWPAGHEEALLAR